MPADSPLKDACLACFPGDAPAAVPLAIQANSDGTLAADYRCPLCGLAWRTDWTVTAWPAVRAYRTTSQLLDELIGLLAGLLDPEELEAALNRRIRATCPVAPSRRGSTRTDGCAKTTSRNTENKPKRRKRNERQLPGMRPARRLLRVLYRGGRVTATPGQAAQALALLDEVLEDVTHVVEGNPDWIDREMLNDYSERAEVIAAQEPHAAAGVWTVAECLERIGDLAGALHEIKTAYTPGTYAHDLAHATLDQSGPAPQPAPGLAAAKAALARVLSWFAGNGTRREASATRAQLARAHSDGGLTVPEELRRFL